MNAVPGPFDRAFQYAIHSELAGRNRPRSAMPHTEATVWVRVLFGGTGSGQDWLHSESDIRSAGILGIYASRRERLVLRQRSCRLRAQRKCRS